MSTTPAGRPTNNGVRRPLTFADPIEWWEEEAERLGLHVDELRAQVRLVDEILEEILDEERKLNTLE